MDQSAPAAPGRIFISYRREDTAYPAGWLFDRLADHYGGGQIFKDVDSIEPGDDFVELITRAVGSCDVLLALIGEEWLTIADEQGRRRLDNPEDFVRLEIQAALTRKVRVIPILVDGARMPRTDELPGSLALLVRRQALELSPARFDFDLGRLLKVLDRTLAEVQAQPAARVAAREAAAPPTPPPDGGPRAADERRTAPSIALALDPVVSQGRQAGEHALTVANRGGQPAGVTVATYGAEELDTAVSPSALWVEAGGRATATLRVRPRRRLVAGRTRRHRFRAIASIERTPVAAAEGAMLQRPLAPWWLLSAALLAGLLVVALVLRPQPPAAAPGPDGTDPAGPEAPAVVPLPPGTSELVVGFVDRFAAAEGNAGSLLGGFDPILSADPKDGRLRGLNVDLANELAARLRVEFRFERLRHFTHSLSDVANRHVHVGMSVLRDREEGRRDVDFIDYLNPGSALLVPERDRDALRSLENLCGRTVVRPIEMTAGSLVEQSHRCKANGRPGITLMSCPQLGSFKPDADEGVPLRECPAGSDPLRLVIDGSVDAAVVDHPVAARLVKTSGVGGQLAIARPAVRSAPYGIAVRKGDSTVRDSLQSALRAVIADGTYDRILAKWNLQRRALKTAAVNGGP
jgi:ABC-type amino acid transport substrate-binding protein